MHQISSLEVPVIQTPYRLYAVDLFRDLSKQDIDDIHQVTRTREYPEGHIFYMPANPCASLYIVKEGQVQLYRISPDGRKLILAMLHKGMVFGHMGLVAPHAQHTYAQCISSSQACSIRYKDFQAIMYQKPVIAIHLLEILGQQLAEAEQQLEEAAFLRIPARLATLILRLAQPCGEGQCKVEGYTHQDLADMLGTYRETITQVLNEFRQQTLIELGRKSILIQNYDALSKIAGMYESV
ncbi:MAG: Crp/Fnr family transcriptional regulator [Phototrophicaceae bacterium]